MSGTQSALFGGGSRWINNPKHLARISVFNTKLSLKTAQSTTAKSDASGFFTALALRGASTSITVADTYVTVANLTGAGFLVNCVSPTHSGTFTPTIRITIDGTVYTIAPSAAQTALNRMVLGPLTPGASASAAATAATAYDIVVPNGSQENGFSIAAVGGVNQITSAGVEAFIVTPESALSYGMQVLRFESSCLVEMKASLLSGTAVDKQCGATYIMDL